MKTAMPTGRTTQKDAMPASAAPRQCRRRRLDQRAVSDVLGSILMIGITVMMATAFGAVLFAFKGPTDSPQANVDITVDPGNAAWGNGDERLVVQNNGGEALKDTETTIVYTVNGGTPVSVTGAALGFAGGKLAIGQAWTRTLTLQATDVVRISVVSGHGATSLLGQSVVIPAQVSTGASCPFDGTAPTGVWTSSADVTTALGSSAVDVTFAAQDDCAGVDDSTAATPDIFWAVTPGSPTDHGAMTKVAPSTWKATIPAPSGGWQLQGLQTLNYYASPVKDLRGNSGASPTRADVVDISGTPTYVTGHTEIAPTTITGFANLGADDGMTESSQEGLGTTATTCTAVATTLNANAVVSTGTGWSNLGTPTGTNVFTSDNLYGTNANSAPGALRLGFPNPTPAGTICAVKVKVEQSISPFLNDLWQPAPCNAGGSCGTAPASQAGSSADSVLTFDVTSFHGTWSWTDVNNFEASVQPVLSLTRDGTWRLDVVQLEVWVQTYTVTQQFDWTGVPVGTQASPGVHYLDLKVAGASDESFSINVYNWNSATFVPRLAVSGTAMQQLTYALQPNEYQVGTGNVRIQVVDTPMADLTQSSVTYDYLRVDTV